MSITTAQLGRIAITPQGGCYGRTLDGTSVWAVEGLVRSGDTQILLDALDSAGEQIVALHAANETLAQQVVPEWERELLAPPVDAIGQEARIRELEAKVAAHERTIATHDEWVERLTRDAHEAANHHGYCSEFDDFMADHGLRRRTKQYRVELNRTRTINERVFVYIEATDEDEATDQALESDDGGLNWEDDPACSDDFGSPTAYSVDEMD